MSDRSDFSEQSEHDNTEERRNTLLERVLDFVAPQDKNKARTSTQSRNDKDIDTPRATSYFAHAVPKNPNPLKLSSATARLLGLILLAVVTVNLLAFSKIATNRFFTLAENLIYLFRLDNVTFQLNSLLEVQIILSFVLSALLGGLLIYFLLKFTLYLSERAGLSVQRRHLTYILAALTVLFFVFFLISRLNGYPYYTYETFRFLAPFLAYAGGLAMYGLSVLRFEV